MSDARTRFLIEEALVPLLARVAALSQEVADLHAELHNAVSKPTSTTARRTAKD